MAETLLTEPIVDNQAQVAVQSLGMGYFPVQVKNEAQTTLRLQAKKQRCVAVGQLNAAEVAMG